MRECREKCGPLKASRSLINWIDHFDASKMSFEQMIEMLNCIFNNGLIDKNEDAAVQVNELEVHILFINELIKTGTPVDKIAFALLGIRRTELLYALTEYVIDIGKLKDLELMRIFYVSQAKALHKGMRQYYANKLAVEINGEDEVEGISKRTKATVDDIW